MELFASADASVVAMDIRLSMDSGDDSNGILNATESYG
jgi:hypothetical protein